MVRETDPLNRPTGPQPERPPVGEPAVPPARGRMAEYHAAHSSQEAREQLERTRSRMTDTLNVLEEKLAPRRLLDQVVDMFKSAGGESRVIDTIRQNPVPTILIAAGVTWLVIDSMREEDEDYRVRRPSRSRPVRGSMGESAGKLYESGKQGVAQAAESMGEKASEAAESIRDKVSQAAESVRDKVSDMAGAARERASQGGRSIGEKISGAVSSLSGKAGDAAHMAREKARSWMGGTQERMGQMRGRAREMASRSGQTFWDTYDDYPLATAAGVLAAGVLAGLILPSTRRERKWIGPTRDRAMESGRRMTEQAVGTVSEKVSAVATAAADAATEKYREQRETGESIVDKAKQMYTEGKEAAKEKMRQEGISREGIAEGIEQKARDIAGQQGLAGTEQTRQESKPSSDQASGQWDRKPGPREPFGGGPEPEALGGSRPSGEVDRPIGGVAPEAIAEAPEEPLDMNDLPTDVPPDQPEDRGGPTPPADQQKPA